LAALFLWHKPSRRTKDLGERIQAFSWRGRFRLAGALAFEERIPVSVRTIIPIVVLYLALPLDFVPDFIPVLGQIDDIVVLAVGAGLMMKFAPVGVLELHLASLEAEEGLTGNERRRSRSGDAKFKS
jgi:uncharacterized membrane protein YkvA (DUF1232 family)